MRCSRGRDEVEAEPDERVGDRNDRLLVRVADGDERRPARRQGATGGALGLRERGREVSRRRHHLPRGPHLGPKYGVGAREARERKHRSLDADLCGRRVGREIELPQVGAGGESAGRGDEIDSARLARKRHRPRGARVDFEHVELAVGDRELDVQEADDAERRAELADDLFDVRPLERAQSRRGQHAGRVAGMDAGLLDVLHHGRDVGVLAVAESVDVQLERLLEEAVEQDASRRIAHGQAHFLGAVADPHRAAPEHVRGPHQHRVADPLRRGDRFVRLGRRAPVRAADLQPVEQRAETLAVLGEVDRLRRGAEEAVAGGLERPRELQRRLTAELRDDADRPLTVADRKHLLDAERLEVEPVGGVVVGRDRLGVAVHHHGLVAELPESLRGVDAAVVEFDSLADPVGA